MKTELFANEDATARPEAQLFVNVTPIDDTGWVQLAPYGDFLNVDSKGQRVIQRFQKQDAETIVNEFNSLLNVPQRLLGLPWYIGHPDHPRFKGVHTDTKSYGRIKKLEVRDGGLYANVKFGAAGQALLDDEAFHGHSVNWRAIPFANENGIAIWRPVSLKSVGFTNEPQIPVRPASLSNEAALIAADFDEPMTGYAVGTDPNEKKENESTDPMLIPPRLKILAGFKSDDSTVTMDQLLAALEKKVAASAPPTLNTPTKAMQNEKPVELTIGDEKFSVVFANDASAALPERITKLTGDLEANKKSRVKAEQDLVNEKAELTAMRKGRATFIVDTLVKAGKVLMADQAAKIEELCNAATCEAFNAKAQEFANAKTVVKTTAKSSELAGKHLVMNGDLNNRQVRFEALMSARSQQFPNEAYQDRFAAVSSSDEGAQLIGQMKRSGAEE